MTSSGDRKGLATQPEKGRELPKVPTHIVGLDEILEGGLPKGRMSLFCGGPGSGKSVSGIEFLYRGAIDGEPGILVCFEERIEAMRENAATMGWDIPSRVLDQIMTRRIRVIKYRGSDFGSNEYPFIISDRGLHVVPITAVELQYEELGPHFSAGHPKLDSILGDGYRRASSTLIAGAAGTGKSTLAATFARAACERGEKVLYINFEESVKAMVSGMLSPGVDLRPCLEDESLKILAIMPEAIVAEQHLVDTMQMVEVFQPDHVILDAISACRRMGSDRAAFEYVMRVVGACKERGITTFLLNQVTGLSEGEEFSGIGLSSIIDNIISLRYLDIGGEINRVLLVVKSRGSKHSNQYREFLITDNGVDIAEVYVGEGGVLTGVARQEQEAREKAERILKEQEIKRKMKEVARQRAVVETEAVRQQSELAAAEAEVEYLELTQEVLMNARDVRGGMRSEDADSSRRRKAPLKRKRKRAARDGDAE